MKSILQDVYIYSQRLYTKRTNTQFDGDVVRFVCPYVAPLSLISFSWVVHMYFRSRQEVLELLVERWFI